MGNSGFDDYDDEDEDLAALFVMGDLYEDNIGWSRNNRGGCLTTILIVSLIPVLLTIIALKV